MAKQTRAKQRKAAAKPAPAKPTPDEHVDTHDAGPAPAKPNGAKRAAKVAPSPAVAPGEEPAFFFRFEISWAKLVVTRVLFFTLLAMDAVMQLSHSPRYGAGDFNIAQLPGFDALAPGRELHSIAELVMSYLLVLAACGVATRVVLPITTVLYGWVYFASHLDSYQHHYLVWLLLLLSCFIPWQRPPDATPATPVRSWAMRVLLLELAILYLWAAISKMSSAWLDGSALAVPLAGDAGEFIRATTGYAGAAWLVLISELVLAATIWWKRGWHIAAPIGLGLHLGIAKTGLEIGLFAWLMLGLYALIIPDRIWVWLADRQPARGIRSAVAVFTEWFHGSTRFAIWALAACIGAVLAMVSRFHDGPAVGLGLVVALLIGTVFAVFRRRTHVAWLAVAHLLAFVLWTAVDRTTTVASDYYRFWGGSSRRLGDAETAESAYRQMTEVAPDDGNAWYQLARLLLARGAGDEGLAALHKAQDLEPLRARSYVAEAKWLLSHGQRDQAYEKAREATIVEPNDADAKALLDSLSR